jgi:hypothetical protein
MPDPERVHGYPRGRGLPRSQPPAVAAAIRKRERQDDLRSLALLLAGFAFAAAAPTAVPPRSGVSPAPFDVGEKTVYHVEWNPPWYLFFLPRMDAGVAELSVAEEVEYKGKKALKIVFQARSSGTFVKLAGIKVDDRFEFLSDPETLCTMSVTKKILEGKRRRSIEVEYMPGTKQLRMREVDLAVVPARLKKDVVKDGVPACVRDLFSALYFVRRLEFYQGASHKALVGDDDKFKEVLSRVEKSEMVETPAGKFQTWRVNTVALVGGLFKEGGQFRMWLTADERKLPVQFEAKVSLGTVTGKLQSAEF